MDCKVACLLGDFLVLDVLGEFMNEQDARRITTSNGLDLFKLSSWLMLHSSNLSVDSLAFAKGLSICHLHQKCIDFKKNKRTGLLNVDE